jgi:glycosyltransferase involved in cell wall biosynthesis
MDLSKLKICFLAGTLGQGGAEQQLFYNLSVLRQCGTDVRLLCLSQHEFWEDRIKRLGVPIIYVGQAESKPRRLFHIIAELRRAPPAIFQSQHFFASAYVGVAARLLRIPGIGALRSNGFSEVLRSGRVGSWLNLRAPKVIVANSQAAIRYATEYGVRPERLYFLPNAVDTNHLRPGVRSGGETVRLIGVGRLHEPKRFDRFLSTLARLRREGNRPVTGVIVGDGPLQVQLEKQAQALGLLPSAVEFKGRIADVAPIYREADIYVLTSDHEGTPNVLLEAMSSGLPVVATRVGGVSAIISEGENGFTADVGDEDGLFAALVRLVDDPQCRMRMGLRAREFVERNHSLELLPGRLSDLYRHVLSTPLLLNSSSTALNAELAVKRPRAR